MLEVKDRFLNFPIALLQGFTENHLKCLSKIFDYGVYTLTFSELRIFETIDEFEENFEFEVNREYLPGLMKRGKELFDSFYGTKYVWTGIHISTWERNYEENRSKKDLMVLLAFLAFKSIIQKKPWAVISNKYLLARMSGFDSANDCNLIPEGIRQFMETGSRTRTWLFTELETTKYGLKRKPGNQRGIICSFTLSREDLIFEHEVKKSLNKAKTLKEEKKKDQMRANERLKQWRKDNNIEEPKKLPKKPPRPKNQDYSENYPNPPT